jgi:hypothetical protein
MVHESKDDCVAALGKYSLRLKETRLVLFLRKAATDQ